MKIKHVLSALILCLAAVVSAEANLIISQPQNISLSALNSQTASFSVSATGGIQPLSYQWMKDGVILTNQRNASLVISNATANTVGYYSCQVTDSASNSVTSSNASLNIDGVNFWEWQGLVAYYPFNGDFNDYSFRGNNITSNSGFEFVADRFGKTNAAILFNSTNSSAQSLNNIGLSGNAQRSLTFWLSVDINQLPNAYGSTILGYGVSSNNQISPSTTNLIARQWIFQLRGDLDKYQGSPRYPGIDIWAGYADYNADFTTNPFYNNWHQVSYVYSGTLSNTVIYIDGTPTVGSAEWENVLTNSFNTIDAPFIIGQNIQGFSAFKGARLSDVHIFNRALSSNEVASLYNLESTPSPSVNGFFYSTNTNSVTILEYTGTNESVTIPSTIEGLPVTSIGDNAFANNSTVTNIVIPYGVTSIGLGSFSGCSNLASITIPNSVISVGTGAFSNSPNLNTINATGSTMQFLSDNAAAIGLNQQAISSYSPYSGQLVSYLLSSTNFLGGLASSPIFLTSLSSQISLGSNSYGFALKSDIAGLSNRISSNVATFSTALSNAYTALNTASNALSTAINTQTGTLSNSLSSQIAGNVSSFSTALSNAYSALNGLSNSLSGQMSSNVATVATALSNAYVKLNTASNALSSSIASSASNLSNALSNSIASLSNQFSPTNPAFIAAIAAQLQSASNNDGIAVKQNQTLNFPAIPTQTYKAGKTIKLSVTTSAGSLPITYSSANSAVATVAGNVLTLTGSGTATITATQVGSALYNPVSAAQPLSVK